MNDQTADKLMKLMDEPDFSSVVAAAESSEGVLKLLYQYGVEITEAELNELLSKAPAGKGEELEESDLEDVSGGGIGSWLWNRFRAGIKSTRGSSGGGHGGGSGRHG